MKLLDFFRGKSEFDTGGPTITTTPRHEDSMVFVKVDWKDSEPKDEAAFGGKTGVTLSFLRTLSQTDLVEQRGDYSFEIPFSSIPQLDSLQQTLLGLEPKSDWKTKVRVGGVIGRGNPDLYLVFTDSQGRYDVVGRELVTPVECGFWSLERDELIVLPTEILALRRRCKRGPDDLGKDRHAAEYRFVAEVKELALKAREALGEDAVELAGQLWEENFVAADIVRAHVEEAEDGGFELYPTVEGMDDEKSRRQLLEAHERKELFTRRDKTKTTRVALSPQCRREVHRVRKRHRVPPEDVRDFLRDPRSYIQPPEELSAERREIAESQGIPLEEVEDSPDFDPDNALDLDRVERLLEDFDVRLYGDRVIGVAVDAPTLPCPDNARTTDLGDWSGTENESLPDDGFADDGPASDVDSEPGVAIADETASIEAPSIDSDHEEQEEPASSTPGPESTGKTTPDDVSPSVPGGQARLVTIDNDEEAEFIIESRKRRQRRFEDFGAPTLFDGTLRPPYQTEGYVWLRELEDMDDAGGLLADDMGMGKTVQVIALLAHLAEEHALRPSLLVVPKSTLQNWQNEISDFCSADLDCYQHLGSARHRNADDIIDHDIVLTTYATLRNDQLTLGEIRFSVMVCDEAQRIKNYTSGRATACRAMNAGLRLALTATPVENGLIELWSILDFCQPGRLDSMAAFKKQFVEPIEAGDKQAQQTASTELLQQMTPHYLRRTKDRHFTEDFPDKFVHRNTVSMTDAQRIRYDQVRQWYTTEEGSAFGAINAMLRICAHPDAVPIRTERKIGLSPRPMEEVLEVPDDIIARSEKFQFVIRKLREVQRQGERAILFSSQRNIQAMLQVVASHVFGLQPYLINGDIPAGRRQQIVDQFNDSPGFNLIILSPRAAGVGINVTGANHVFHVTREWNPAVENQATDRAYRIGQNKDVHVYVPITAYPDGELQTLDERLDKLLEAKRNIAENSIAPRGLGTVTRNELEEGLA